MKLFLIQFLFCYRINPKCQSEDKMRINPLGLLVIYGLILCGICCRTPDIENVSLSRLDKQLLSYVNKTFSVDKYKIFDGVSIERKEDGEMKRICEGESRTIASLEDYIKRRFEDYTKTHVVSIKIPETGRFFKCKFNF